MKQEQFKIALVSNVLAIITISLLGIIIGGSFKLHSEATAFLAKIVVISPVAGLLTGIIGLFLRKQRTGSVIGTVLNGGLLMFVFYVFLELFR